LSIVYAESSAVLRWLLGDALGAEIQTVLASAEAVVSSALTSVEVARSLARLRAANTIPVERSRQRVGPLFVGTGSLVRLRAHR
jgi:predicted nucleic acid-binding protein